MTSHTYKNITLAGFGQVEYENYLFPFIDSPNFQQLRLKKNMAFVDRAYPSGGRNRLDHSLGVSYIARLIYDALMRAHPDTFTDTEREFHRRNIQFAGLGHDLPHGPLSHTIEPVYFKFARKLARIQPTSELTDKVSRCEDHEELAHIVLQGGRLFQDVPSPAQFIQEAGADPERVSQLILKGRYHAAHPETGWLQELIFASHMPFDADMLEYIRRDPYFLGLKDQYDLDIIIKNLRLHEGGIAVREKALAELGSAVLTFNKLCNVAYFHHTGEKLDAMLVNLLGYTNFEQLPGQPLLYGDEILVHELCKLKGRRGELAQMIRDRHLYAEIDLDPSNTSDEKLRAIDKQYYAKAQDAPGRLALKCQLEQRIAKAAGVSKYDVATDFRARGMTISEKRDKNPIGDITIIGNDGAIKQLKDLPHEQISTLKRLPRVKRPLSIYAPQEHKKAVEDAANDLLAKL